MFYIIFLILVWISMEQTHATSIILFITQKSQAPTGRLGTGRLNCHRHRYTDWLRQTHVGTDKYRPIGFGADMSLLEPFSFCVYMAEPDNLWICLIEVARNALCEKSQYIIPTSQSASLLLCLEGKSILFLVIKHEQLLFTYKHQNKILGNIESFLKMIYLQ